VNKSVHLVGSVPLEDAESVMATCCTILGAKLDRVPDGETGVRSNWIHWQRDLLGSHPAMHVVGEGKNADRVMPRFAVKNDFDKEIVFTDLGYYTAALDSYKKYTALRELGKIGRQRFQVSLPTPLATIACYVDEASQERVYPSYEKRLLAECQKITDTIPQEDLAIQWDVAIELAILEGLFPVWFNKEFKTIVEQLSELAELIPHTVEVGYHFCYGDAGNKHFKEPEDMNLLIQLANSLSKNVQRTIQWIHMPVPIDRDDADYFRPLKELEADNIEQLFLGLIHEQDGIEGARKRMAAADMFSGEYGIATECGLGRRKPDVVMDLLELHAGL